MKKELWFLIIIVFLVIGYVFIFEKSPSQIKKSVGMGAMVIEEKHHYIEPGKYFEMWVIGYNAYEKEEDRERYKIFIEESLVYNLIEEGAEYVVSATSFRKDEEFGYVYKLEQISNQEKYQLGGKGRIK